MKIATWNINSVRARLPHLLGWLKESGPDVVLLQETKVVDDLFPAMEIEDMGYNVATWGEKSYNGVAILSKFPLEDIVRGLPGAETDIQTRYIEALVGDVRVASIYVPNGNEVGSDKFAYKLRFMERLRAHTKTLLSYEEAFVLGGDYNIAAFDEDLYDATHRRDKLLSSPQERAALRTLLNDGLTDALRVLEPENHSLYTWWDYRAGSFENNNGYRIDHMLLSPQGADRLVSSGVDTHMRALEKASDHAPVYVTLGKQKDPFF